MANQKLHTHFNTYCIILIRLWNEEQTPRIYRAGAYRQVVMRLLKFTARYPMITNLGVFIGGDVLNLYANNIRNEWEDTLSDRIANSNSFPELNSLRQFSLCGNAFGHISPRNRLRRQ